MTDALSRVADTLHGLANHVRSAAESIRAASAEENNSLAFEFVRCKHGSPEDLCIVCDAAKASPKAESTSPDLSSVVEELRSGRFKHWGARAEYVADLLSNLQDTKP
jgi:hypothetical protein